MKISSTPSSVCIEILPALHEQKPILANLLELYIYDFSELMDLKLDDNGRFGYPQLPLYWTEPHRFPFLIAVDGHWAGFVLVHKGSQISGDEHIWDIAEFFILRGYRRLGIGTQVAAEIWKKFPGTWEVRVIDQNQKATAFWGRAIEDFTGTAVDPTSFVKDGKSWRVFSFDSKHAA
ncbi:MAG: GNAT family N-acetyltransferase [Acidobacteria bacterium]|nr:GNAT family N-acetyltransferase [Acidobacteriota bacterium]